MILCLRVRSIVSSLIAAALLLTTCSLFAQSNTRTLTVKGTGQAKVQPDLVEIPGRISGRGKLAEDALTKFEGNKRRLNQAVEKLSIPNLTMETHGPAIQTVLGVGEGVFEAGDDTPKPNDNPILVAENIVFRLKTSGTQKELFQQVLTVIDLAKDTGVVMASDPNRQLMAMFGNQFKTEVSIASFRLANPNELRRLAFEAAIADAREQAKQIADLTGKAVGELVSISDVQIKPLSEKREDRLEFMRAMYGLDAEKPEVKPYTSEYFGHIRAEAILTVTFEVKE